MTGFCLTRAFALSSFSPSHFPSSPSPSSLFPFFLQKQQSISPLCRVITFLHLSMSGQKTPAAWNRQPPMPSPTVPLWLLMEAISDNAEQILRIWRVPWCSDGIREGTNLILLDLSLPKPAWLEPEQFPPTFLCFLIRLLPSEVMLYPWNVITKQWDTLAKIAQLGSSTHLRRVVIRAFSTQSCFLAGEKFLQPDIYHRPKTKKPPTVWAG